jgi:hypothetical protein
VVTTGVASAGVAGALADGVRGAADADLKTALAVLATLALTAFLGTLIRALEDRLTPRQAEPSAISSAEDQPGTRR